MGHVQWHERERDVSRYEVLFERQVDPSAEPTADVVPSPEDRVSRLVVTSGSSLEVVGGLCGFVLAVVGLAGYAQVPIAAVATIAVGFSLLVQGTTIAARWREAVRIAGSERTDAMGIGTEMFGGFAGLVLGVLALLGIMPLTLIPAAALVLGVALLLGGPAQPDLAELAPATSAKRYHVTRSAVRTSSGVMVMGGLAGIILGALASAELAPPIPAALVALLCMAASLLLAGGTLFAGFARRFT